MTLGIDEIIAYFGYPALPPHSTRHEFWTMLFNELSRRPVADLVGSGERLQNSRGRRLAVIL